MPPKRVVPHREGYNMETHFPKTGSRLDTPLHGAGPRCRVDYSPDDDGPWATLQIMRVDDDQTEHYTCAMPRYYAVPLILMNKRIAYFEAQCTPDGTPLPLGNGSVGLGRREIKEYTYLWRVRSRFLQAVFDMNHGRELDEGWECDKIHGFVHRTYKRYGHDAYQRHAYWGDEIKAGRMPYTTPDLSDMDWKTFIAEEMTASTRLNAFLWNRVSQGYSRVVQDDPPFSHWQAWRTGGTSRDLNPSLYHTPPPSPAPGGRTRRRSSSRSQSAEQEQQEGPGETVAASTSQNSARAREKEKEKAASAAPNPIRRGSATSFEGDSNNNMDCGGILAAATATFDGQDWALTFPTSDRSRGAGQAAASTGGTGDPSLTHMHFVLGVPKDMAVTDVLLTISRVEDINDNHETTLRVTSRGPI